MFRVGITRDFLTPEGELTYKDMGLGFLDDCNKIEYEFIKAHHAIATPEMLDGYNAVISLAPAYNADSFEGITDLKAICRFGVGYDMINIDACNKANVLLTVTRGAVNHSVAESIITWMLALSHNVFAKDKLVRTGKWSQRNKYTGIELRQRTLGIIGLGGIGKKLVEMLQAFGMNRPLAYDPYINNRNVEKMGVEAVDLDTLLKRSDFISINCPLTNETKNLIDKRNLSLVKENAFIINTARGGIVNEEALVERLVDKSIAGYASDVFEHEPVSENNPLLELDNVILAPHCIAWTDELFKEIGSMVCQQVVQIAEGRVPAHIVNDEILEKWKIKNKIILK